MFEVIDSNKRKTFIIVVLFVVLLSGVVIAIGYFNNIEPYFMLPIALILSIFTSIGTYYFSDSIILSISGARPADQREHKVLHDELEGLCIAAGLSNIPKLYVIDDSAPNAFATGRNPENSVICVTTGLLDKLDKYELEAVLAHELAHIKNYDILLSTIATVLVGTVTLLADWFTRSIFYGRRRGDRSKGNPILLIIGLILIILAPIIGQLLKMSLSRNREFLADATAVEFTRNPQNLIDALTKLTDDREPLEAANKATANMYIVSPFKGREEASWLERLYSTHPPIQERVDALKNIH